MLLAFSSLCAHHRAHPLFLLGLPSSTLLPPLQSSTPQPGFQTPTEPSLKNSIPPRRLSFQGHPATRNWRGQSLQTLLIRSPHPALYHGFQQRSICPLSTPLHQWHFPNAAASSPALEALSQEGRTGLCVKPHMGSRWPVIPPDVAGTWAGVPLASTASLPWPTGLLVGRSPVLQFLALMVASSCRALLRPSREPFLPPASQAL